MLYITKDILSLWEWLVTGLHMVWTGGLKKHNSRFLPKLYFTFDIFFICLCLICESVNKQQRRSSNLAVGLLGCVRICVYASVRICVSERKEREKSLLKLKVVLRVISIWLCWFWRSSLSIIEINGTSIVTMSYQDKDARPVMKCTPSVTVVLQDKHMDDWSTHLDTQETFLQNELH